MSGSSSSSNPPLSLNSLPPEILANVGMYLTPAERASARLIGRYQSGVFSRQPLKVFRVTVFKSITRLKQFKKRLVREFSLFTDSLGNVKSEDVNKLVTRRSYNDYFIDTLVIPHEIDIDILRNTESFPELALVNKPDFLIMYDRLLSHVIDTILRTQKYSNINSLFGTREDLRHLLQTSRSNKTYVRTQTINILYEIFRVFTGIKLPEDRPTLESLNEILLIPGYFPGYLSDRESEIINSIIRAIQEMGARTEAMKIKQFSALFDIVITEEMLIEKFSLTPD
jgi:hypothetical protein